MNLRIFISSVQKEFAEERRLLKRYIPKNQAIKKEGLFVEHSSYPNNNLIADQLYQVKYIEGFDAEFTDLVDGCRSAGLPVAVVDDEHSGFALTIWRNRADLETGRTNRGSSQEILSVLCSEPFLPSWELAERLMISRRSVAKHIVALQMSGELRSVSPDKGGHWEVIGGK